MTNGRAFSTALSRRAFIGGTAAAAAALAGCAPGGGTPGTKGDVVKFWNMQWNGTAFTNVARKIVNGYQPAGKNLGVSYQSISWTGWYQTFTSAAASGTTPAVTDGAAFLPFLFQEQGLTIPADNVIAELEKKGEADYLPGILEASKTKDGYALVPWAEDLRVLWYRKSVLEKAGADVPTDWDTFRCRNIAAKDRRHRPRDGRQCDRNGRPHHLLSVEQQRRWLFR